MLDDADLQLILADWKAWSKRPLESVPRAVAGHCLLSPNLVTVIQGVRRCGKSTLLRQLMQTNQIPEEQAVFYQLRRSSFDR